MAHDRPNFATRRTPPVMESGAIGKGCLIGLGFGVVLLILIAMTVGQYNGLVDKQEGTKKAWQEIDNQYKRRNDLVGNLVETVKGAANFEKSTLVAVTEARASVGRVTLPPPTDEAAAQNYLKVQEGLGSALQKLLVVSENYPDLKATGNFADLQSQLEGTENRIAVARRDYLDVAQTYNAAIRKFPANFLAGMFNFTRAAELPVTEAERAVPKVDFGGQK
jgi:LemA protein